VTGAGLVAWSLVGGVWPGRGPYHSLITDHRATKIQYDRRHIFEGAGRGGLAMPTYVVLYKYTSEGAKNIRESIKRAGRIRQDNARAGFKVRDVFWTQGAFDMVAVVDAPSEEAMMGAMLNVVSAGNVTSTMLRAFDATEMSRILAQTPSLSQMPAARKAAGKKKAR
jgi:uncharacterized protein with GYD domain